MKTGWIPWEIISKEAKPVAKTCTCPPYVAICGCGDNYQLAWHPTSRIFPMAPSQESVTIGGSLSSSASTSQWTDDSAKIWLMQKGYVILNQDEYRRIQAQIRPHTPAKKPCVYVGGSRYCKVHDEWHA